MSEEIIERDRRNLRIALERGWTNKWSEAKQEFRWYSPDGQSNYLGLPDFSNEDPQPQQAGEKKVNPFWRLEEKRLGSKPPAQPPAQSGGEVNTSDFCKDCGGWLTHTENCPSKPTPEPAREDDLHIVGPLQLKNGFSEVFIEGHGKQCSLSIAGPPDVILELATRICEAVNDYEPACLTAARKTNECLEKSIQIVKLEADKQKLESEISRLKSACNKEFESVQMLDDLQQKLTVENQKLEAEVAGLREKIEIHEGLLGKALDREKVLKGGLLKIKQQNLERLVGELEVQAKKHLNVSKYYFEPQRSLYQGKAISRAEDASLLREILKTWEE